MQRDSVNSNAFVQGIVKHGLKRESVVENHIFTQLTTFREQHTDCGPQEPLLWQRVEIDISFYLNFILPVNMIVTVWNIMNCWCWNGSIKYIWRSSVAENARRQALAAKLNGVVFEANGKHIPSVIDACIVNCNIAGINAATTEDCIQLCSGNRLLIHLELMEGFTKLPDGNGVLPLIIGPLHRKHNVHCCSIVVFAYGTNSQIVMFKGSPCVASSWKEDNITNITKNTTELWRS